jgi:hypothetical protein
MKNIFGDNSDQDLIKAIGNRNHQAFEREASPLLAAGQLQSIRSSFLPRVEETRNDLCIKRAKLADLLFAEPIDKSKINETYREILRYQSELESDVIDHILEEKELLSPSQQKRFYEIIVDQFSSSGLGVHDVKGSALPGFDFTLEHLL